MKVKDIIAKIPEKKGFCVYKYTQDYYEAIGYNKARTEILNSDVDLSEEEIRRIITTFGQLTSKYPDKKHLLAGDNTFISCSQYDDLAKTIDTAIKKRREKI